MSGIYIPGLKDLSCDDCFWGIGCRLGCHATTEAATRKINNRASDCPLIFLEDHGGLIDADALVRSYYHAPSFPNLCKAINDAPIIIPADKEAKK